MRISWKKTNTILHEDLQLSAGGISYQEESKKFARWRKQIKRIQLKLFRANQKNICVAPELLNVELCMTNFGNHMKLFFIAQTEAPYFTKKVETYYHGDYVFTDI